MSTLKILGVCFLQPAKIGSVTSSLGADPAFGRGDKTKSLGTEMLEKIAPLLHFLDLLLTLSDNPFIYFLYIIFLLEQFHNQGVKILHNFSGNQPRTQT